MVRLWLFIGVLGASLVSTHVVANADTNVDVQTYLQSHDVYISASDYAHGKAHAGDEGALLATVQDSARSGVTEKIALIRSYPAQYANTEAAANGLRRVLDLAGVLVLVSPHGIGISSSQLSQAQIRSIESRARSICLRSTFTACAIYAATESAKQSTSNGSASTRNIIIFWIVVLAVFGGVITFFVRRAGRRKKAVTSNLQDMRHAANQTLSLADEAVGQIEGSGTSLPSAAQSEYDQALGLRQRAKAEIETASSAPGLVQANQDAAQAVLALKSVMEAIGLQSSLTNPLDVTARKCFYCAREDRAPYTERTIDDNKGHTMQIEICDVCRQILERGRTPQVATVPYGGSVMPWWAVPNSPWYYSYGGPSWQYWLPFMVGMDVGGWYGGGYGGYGYGDYDGGYYGDNNQQAGGTDSGTGAGDTGAGDFGDWGDQGSWGGDTGGFGGDSGGGDWGGGGGDSGGGWS